MFGHYLVKLCPNSSDSLLPNDLVMHIVELCDTYMTYEGLGGGCNGLYVTIFFGMRADFATFARVNK